MIDKEKLLKSIDVIQNILMKENDLMGSVVLRSLALVILEGKFDIRKSENA